MPQRNNERQLNLAIKARQQSPKLSLRAIARVYSVDHRRLGDGLRGVQPRRDSLVKSKKLTNLEEAMLIQHILDLCAKGFPPRLSVVGAMADRLLATRDTRRVKRWDALGFQLRQTTARAPNTISSKVRLPESKMRRSTDYSRLV